jgi:hypothetical protein
MKTDFYTYAYLREDGTPYYIGKGRGKRAYSKDNRRCTPPPVERILILKKNLSEGEAFKHEIYMIAVLGRKDIGTGMLWNFTDGGEGSSGVIVSEETRQKQSEKAKERGVPRSTIEAMSEWRRGRKKSPETVEKTASALRGKKRPKEVGEKVSKAKKGQPCHPNTKKALSEKMRGEGNPNFGKPRSEEVKAKIRATIAQKKKEPK